MQAVWDLSRDNARTPFRWNAEEKGGFTTGTPWFPMNPEYKELNAEQESADAHSILAFWKRLIALRRNPDYAEILVEGDFVPYGEDVENLLAYRRTCECGSILTLCNFSDHELEAVLPETDYRTIIDNYDRKLLGRRVTLHPFEAAVLMSARGK